MRNKYSKIDVTNRSNVYYCLDLTHFLTKINIKSADEEDKEMNQIHEEDFCANCKRHTDDNCKCDFYEY